MTDIYLIGSGPSAAGMVIPDNAPVACVNGSFKAINRRPDMYLIGERPAAREYRLVVASMLEDGVTVFARPHARDELMGRLPPECYARIVPINGYFGPSGLRDLHRDRFVLFRTNVPGPRPHAAWISSGLLMLWVLLDLWRPVRAVMAGFDGYPSVAPPDEPVFKPVADWQQGPSRLEGEYAEGIEPLATRPLRMPNWTEAQHDYMGEALHRLAAYYTDSKIVIRRRPLYARPDSNVEYLEG